MRMTKPRLLLASTALLLASCLAAPSFAQDREGQSAASAPGNFDYYLFTLSWSPEFCASNPSGRTSAECGLNKHLGLVVHGLWPQFNNGTWPQDCAPTRPVAASTVNHMVSIMPNRSLIQHEWAKHGTCSGLMADDYFAAIDKLYNGLKIPGDFRNPSRSFTASPSDIEQKFGTANQATPEAFRISCPENKFAALEICVSKEWKYQACPDTVKECHATQAEVLPVP